MPGKQAKIVSPAMLRSILSAVDQSPLRLRDRAMVLLSIKAGLRAAEIAALEWEMVLDAKGRIAGVMALRDAIAKKRAGRHVPMHEDLRAALEALRRDTVSWCGECVGPIIRSTRGGAMRPNSIVNWFLGFYAELGFEGCSSHSGRRTFITNAARNVHRVGCSLRDVQLLAGHRSIETTERYIDGDSEAQKRLVRLL